MTFKVEDLPSQVQNAFNSSIDQHVVYWAARRSGISDVNKLADILFYHSHKYLIVPLWGGMALKPGMPNYSALVAEWKKCKQFAQSLALGKPASSDSLDFPTFADDPGVEWDDLAYGKPEEGWISHAVARKIESTWGREVAMYCRKPPQSDSKPSSALFNIPNSVNTHLGCVIVWKCRNPRDHCKLGAGTSSGHYKIMMVGLLKSDKDYWYKQTNYNEVQAEVLSTTAAAAIRDYRRYIVAHQMCPHAAYQKLYAINNTVLYEMFIGMFQLMSPQGASPLPNMHAMGRSLGPAYLSAAQAFSGIPGWVKQIVDIIKGDFARR